MLSRLLYLFDDVAYILKLVIKLVHARFGIDLKKSEDFVGLRTFLQNRKKRCLLFSFLLVTLPFCNGFKLVFWERVNK